MSIEIEYTTYLTGSTFSSNEEVFKDRGYKVIPDNSCQGLLSLKKTEKRVKDYENLGAFISSFENEVKRDYKEDYLIHDIEICIDRIKININLDD